MPQTLLSWDDIVEEISPNGVGKRLVRGENATLVMVRIPAGIRAERHSHSHEQFVQVVSGGGVLETSEGTRLFRPGSVFHFPPDTWHAATFETETVLIETNLSP